MARAGWTLKADIDKRGHDVLQWDHLPVLCLAWRKDYQPWHTAQVRDAIRVVSEARPNAFAIIPTQSFFLEAPRSQMGVAGETQYVHSVLGLSENVDGIETAEADITTVVCVGDYKEPNSDWGSMRNPYTQLFHQLLDELPLKWATWLKWRRTRIWMPVPAWLGEIKVDPEADACAPDPCV